MQAVFTWPFHVLAEEVEAVSLSENVLCLKIVSFVFKPFHIFNGSFIREKALVPEKAALHRKTEMLHVVSRSWFCRHTFHFP